MNQGECVAAEEVLRFITQHSHDRGTIVEEDSFTIENSNDIQSIFGERAEIFFTADQFSFDAAAVLAFLCFLHRAADGGDQTVWPMLEDIVGGARFETFDCRLLTYGSGNQ